MRLYLHLSILIRVYVYGWLRVSKLLLSLNLFSRSGVENCRSKYQQVNKEILLLFSLSVEIIKYHVGTSCKVFHWSRRYTLTLTYMHLFPFFFFLFSYQSRHTWYYGQDSDGLQAGWWIKQLRRKEGVRTPEKRPAFQMPIFEAFCHLNDWRITIGACPAKFDLVYI